MGVKHTVKINKLNKITKGFDELSGRKVEIGAFGENGWLAGIHEYGCNITAKNSKYLTVPCCPEAYGKSARDFDDLFVLTSKKGNKFLARKTGKDSFKCMYWLTPSVKIPERSFLRAGHDSNINKVLDKASRLTSLMNDGALSAEQYLNQIGELMADSVKTYAKNLSSPAKSSMTVSANGGKDNPLFETGQMIGGITYRTD